MNDHEPFQTRKNVLEFPVDHLKFIEPAIEKIALPTPQVDEMQSTSNQLDALSAYKSQFDWGAMRSLERRASKNPIRGGIVFKSPFKLVNAHSTCQQCLYAFEVDTYGRGCVHNCVYCYAKDQLTAYGYWNNPYPVPVNINSIRQVFYTVFETEKPSKWRQILEHRIPIRIGSMSDSFMWMEDKFKVTKEFLRILKHYNYPYLIFTRSDLIAREDYMALIDEKLAGIQFSISSTDDNLNKVLEPGAPSAKRRLLALKKLNENGFWTTVRLNPFFPTHPDGYFTGNDFSWNGPVPTFPYSSFEMIDQIAESKTCSVLAGMVRLSPYSLNQIEQATGVNYKSFFTSGRTKSSKDFHYSDKEIRYYYEQIKARCIQNGIEFTTCYIGNGNQHFWKDQDLWSNKQDCCNVKGKVPAFVSDSRQIPFEMRLKVSASKAEPVDSATLYKSLGNLLDVREQVVKEVSSNLEQI